MSVDFHRHCQATILSANGTDEQNGLSWKYIDRLKDSLDNLPENWIQEFKGNIENITQDLASILKIMNSTVENYLPLSGGTMTGDLILNGSPETDNQAATKRYVDYMIEQNGGSGTVTGIRVNGVLKGTEGEVDLGNVVSSIKVNGDVKTPNSNGLVDIGTFSVTNTDNSGTTISRINYNGNSYEIKMPQGSGSGEGGQSSFDPSKFHTIFFNPGNATSIEFTTKSLYEGSQYGRLPKYTLGGVEMNTWYLNGTQIDQNSIFSSTEDIELTTITQTEE